MPRFLLLIDDDVPLAEWLASGVASGVVQAHATLGTRQVRVLREGGIPLAVQQAAPHTAVLFEAEDGPSALVWVSSCPGHGGLRVLRFDDNAAGDWCAL